MAKIWTSKKYADRAIDRYHRGEVEKGFKDDLTPMTAVAISGG